MRQQDFEIKRLYKTPAGFEKTDQLSPILIVFIGHKQISLAELQKIHIHIQNCIPRFKKGSN